MGGKWNGFLTLAGALTLAPALAVELNSSILLFGDHDFEQCPRQVERAAALGNSALSFVPTFYFERQGESDFIESYCQAPTDGGCQPMNTAYLTQVRGQLAQCFQRTLELGMTIEVMPHLDDAVDSYWRNNLIFDPLADVDGFSYQSLVIDTIVGALEQARIAVPTLPADTWRDFALAGEMGSSVFSFAQSYRQIQAELKQRYPDMRVGMSFNHNVVAGRGRVYRPSQTREVQQLLDEGDFVGLSAYSPIEANELSPASFQRNIEAFENELRLLHRIELRRDQEIHFSEMGIGGGSGDNDGTRMAADVVEAGEHPYSGIGGPYDATRDPWRRPEFRNFRREYYAALLAYLGDANLRRPTRAYIWNVSSWDVQGLYAGFENYSDPEIIEMIRDWNRYAQ